MLSADGKRLIYEKPQLVETICQLRFPAILSIETKEPAEFQDRIREMFPRYACQTETVPQLGGAQPQREKNHSFISADGMSKLSLAKDFIALSTMRYQGWEQFAGMLDEPLGQFISLYKPAFFERIGLRYVNGFSRSDLGLEGCRWSELLHRQYLGVLGDDGVDEGGVKRCSVDVERTLRDGCTLKLHAGPGRVRRNVRTAEGGVQTVQEPEVRFMLDLDLFFLETVRLGAAAERMETLHRNADEVFADAISDRLHGAMEPVVL